LMTRVSQNFSQ